MKTAAKQPAEEEEEEEEEAAGVVTEQYSCLLLAQRGRTWRTWNSQVLQNKEGASQHVHHTIAASPIVSRHSRPKRLPTIFSHLVIPPRRS